MLTLSHLEQYLSKAAWILKGPVDAADFKVYIFPLLFFKRISDVYDEEYNEALSESEGDHEYASGAEMHRFIIPKGCHWNDVRAVTTNVGSAIKGAFSQIEQANPQYLANIFGDAAWTNKDKLSDELLCHLIEHYSQYNLSNSNVEPDVLGRAYEYLIKMFADQTNKKAGEFYTPRSVVHLMGLIVNPQQGETIYDPACGTAGMLLECVEQVKQNGGDFRTLKLYGQEKNLTTSGIARMNMLLHGFEEFNIVRGNTLSNPIFMEYDELQKFDIVLANPPYSIKSWDQAAFTDDPYGRNIWGTPPQGCADYAFQQHIMKSLKPDTGRCVVLWPHGILFRDAEREMRRKMIESDCVDCVIGLGPNLFYNSPMEACLLICRMQKPANRRGKILFINAVDEVKRDKTISMLEEKHIDKIFKAYKDYKDIPGFAKVVKNEQILENGATLNISQYVSRLEAKEEAPKQTFEELLEEWKKTKWNYKKEFKNYLKNNI